MSNSARPRMHSDVLREIAEVERSSLRALRAVALGVATTADAHRLANAEAAIERLRAELQSSPPLPPS